MDDASKKREQLVGKLRSILKDSSEGPEIPIDQEKLLGFLKSRNAYWILLIPILILSIYVRTRNLVNLGGKYMLGLDPYAFFRYAQEVLQTGTIQAHDVMRYVPLGYTLRMDYKFMGYFLAYTYKIIHFISPSTTQMEWHIIYPPIATLLSFIFLFLFVRKIFDSRVALLSVAFLAVIPTYIYRTGAGFADHEALAMLFMFAALWQFSLMWTANNRSKTLLYGAITGLLSTAMYFTWPGGYRFLIVSLASLGILVTVFNKVNKNQVLGYLTWFISFILFSAIGLRNISFLKELENLMLLFAVVFIVANQLKFVRGFAETISKALPYKIPAEIILLITIALVGIIIGWITGIADPAVIIGRLLHPGGTSRFAFTVSENQQPYFIGGNGWWSGIGWTFLLAFIGSIYMVIKMFKSIKVGLATAASYSIFFIIFIFGRFSPDAKYNSIAAFSSQTYLIWFGMFLATLFGLYIHQYNKDKDKAQDLFNIPWELLLIFVWFLFTAIIARGAVRTIFSFAPAVAIVAAYVTVNLAQDLYRRESLEKTLGLILILFALFCFYANGIQAAQVNAGSGSGLPGQWEQSMHWIRDNTAEDAVVAHWWDYGYWTQTVGERATVVDGGNAMAWDHGMGRYGLTHNNLQESFEYFKTHEVTHLLISEEEISKYHAFATIGSDENFDRKSTFGIFALNRENEIRDGAELIYQGGWGLDQDLVVDMKVLPEGTPLGAISIVNKASTFEAPIAHFFPNGQQISLTTDCLVVNNQRINFDNADIEACVVLLPYFMDSENANPIGTAFFLSSKVRDGNLARLFVYDEVIPGFNKVYDDETPLGMFQGRIIGPIKIWEIQYPAGTQTDDKYLEKSIYG
jgi:asparagine N-glycosylation enzyme membrane subunit Stt3